jgi:hypothetical protein
MSVSSSSSTRLLAVPGGVYSCLTCKTERSKHAPSAELAWTWVAADAPLLCCAVLCPCRPRPRRSLFADERYKPLAAQHCKACHGEPPCTLLTIYKLKLHPFQSCSALCILSTYLLLQHRLIGTDMVGQIVWWQARWV